MYKPKTDNKTWHPGVLLMERLQKKIYPERYKNVTEKRL